MKKPPHRHNVETSHVCSTGTPGELPFHDGPSLTAPHAVENHNNPYAEASQAREFGRSPRPIEDPQSSRPNSRSTPAQWEKPPTTEPLATENQDQRGGPETESFEAGLSTAEDHATQTAPAIVPRLMTVEGVAEYLDFSVSKVWRLRRRDPDFPQQIKIGGSSRWDLAEIDCYIDVCKARRPNGR
jgi:predicted DNA-binding transcriptional regulator AlpA